MILHDPLDLDAKLKRAVGIVPTRPFARALALPVFVVQFHVEVLRSGAAGQELGQIGPVGEQGMAAIVDQGQNGSW